MNLIVLGILLFSFGHMFKRLMPAGREFLDHKFGENLGKGFVALFLVSGVILITFGYYHNEFDIYFYAAPTWLTALMLNALFCHRHPYPSSPRGPVALGPGP